MMWLYLLAAYLLGSIPIGLIVGKTVKRMDIREHGSRNVGATNVFRTVGKGWGIAVLVLDALKGALAVKLPQWTLGHEIAPAWLLAIGITAILGHSFPIWLRFKGGKGVATSLGVFLAIVFIPTLAAFGVFIVVFAFSRIVSLGSVAAAVSYPPILFLLHRQEMSFRWYFPVSCVLAVFILFTHRSNLMRLIRGEEKRLF